MDRSSARQSAVEAWRFVAFTFLWAWLFLLPAVLSSRSADEPWVVVLRILSGISPMVAAVLLTLLYEDRAGRRDYWRRATQWRRVPGRWYAVIFLFVPALALVASLLDRLLGGAGLQLEDTGSSILARPLTVLPLIAFLLFFGPIPEELGWRGYALDRLQARWSAGVASLILGLVWASWHLPLFWIAGTYQQQLGVGSVRFWLYLASFLPQSVLITWVYNYAKRSILSAILLHFMINFTGEILALSLRGELFQSALWMISALLVMRRLRTATSDGAGRFGGGESTDAISAHRRS